MIKKYPKYFISALLIFIFSFILYIFINIENNKTLKISFLDVGQGDSVLVTSPNGNRLLYDAGAPNDKVTYSIEKELGLFDRKINIFIASHPDSDHIGGFASLLQKFSPLYYLDGHTISISSVFSNLENNITDNKISRSTLGMGSTISLGGGAAAYVLSPNQNQNKEYLDSNNSSVVILIKYGESKLLLMGDLEEKEEKNLVFNYGKSLKANILKVAHHGSKTSTSDILLKMVKPEYSIISSGINNKYGHPHASTISRLEYSSTTILETSKMGTIRFRCSKEKCYPIYK